jgi:hypothetical protein
MSLVHASYWMRRMAIAAVVLGGAIVAVVGFQKSAALSAVQAAAVDGTSEENARLRAAIRWVQIDVGAIGYQTFVGMFVALAYVSGPLVLIECYRFARIHRDAALATHLKVQQALREAQAPKTVD